ncbi:zona pellucida protein C [Morone saxatilis]|uniref:zona pellucida protein C n=1 Tax=Morone saxatilis TaxID=34816 RepID=UPI0015E1EB6B|nr:zona pellucida protein C [Morone saxatilis]
MGTIEIVLCVFVGHFVAVQSVMSEQDARYPQHFPGFFDNIMPFPFKRHFDFPPYDTIFSSWRTQAPDFHMLAEFPPLMGLPQVEVFCDESKLTLLVDKRSSGVMLTREEIQLGNGCYSNRELPNQFVFTYGLDECGTTRVMQNGLAMFTNSLHVNFKKPPSTGWQAPSTVYISCIPKRSYANPNFFVSTTLAENDKTLNIKAMNPSWTSTVESNIYKRGQVVNLQVSATARPEQQQQQLFIQSCFVSASPDPQTRPRHAVIMNKGCTAPLGSHHAVVEFVASKRADVVNFVVNTSYLISELYIHCSVLLSDQGVTSGSKFCNYNVIQSRWEDLGGTAEVCECCSSKCKGKHLPEDAKAIVSTGPLVIVDKDVETSPGPAVSEPQETSSAPVTGSMQSDASGAAAEIVSGSSIPRSRLSSPPQGVVVVSQDPAARLTLWLPGQVQDTEHSENTGSESEDNLTVQVQASDTASNDLPELQPSTKDQESLLNTPTNKIEDQNLNFLTLVDGWIIPPQLEKAAIGDESLRRTWRFGLSGTDATQEVDVPLLDDITINVLNQNDLHQMREDLAQRPKDAAVTLQEGINDIGPVIRSKLEFSKGMDGSQMLSYEEEMVKQQEGEGVIRRAGMAGIKKGIQERRQKGLRSTFLDFLRRMDKAE